MTKCSLKSMHFFYGALMKKVHCNVIIIKKKQSVLKWKLELIEFIMS